MDEQTLNDLLECSVCFERLDTTSKVLPCQHTFCRKCIEDIFSKYHELRCPECRILVDVKIDDLPPNVLLMRILEGLKNAAASKSSPDIEVTDKIIKEQDNQIKQSLPKIENIQEHNNHNAQNLQFAKRKINGNSEAPQRANHDSVPHALALHDFKSKEPTDLNFKKGDVIILKRRVDANWYIGYLNGREGTFPISYTNIIVPIGRPLCVALYDFKMGPKEEEGCLSFKKGAVIEVIQRVDHNWGEGRIGDTIGIFPIAFVELNELAIDQLGGISSNNAVPTKLVQTENVINSSTFDNTISINATMNSSNISPDATSPNSAAVSNSYSTPSSPSKTLHSASQHLSSSVRYRHNKDKRHSLNALLAASGTDTPGASSSLNASQSNRYSAEILSVPNELNTEISTVPQHQYHGLLDDNKNNPQNLKQNPQRKQMPHSNSNQTNVLKSSGGQFNLPNSLPWGYMAMYPYKPRKSDELELKKGCVYIVTERCVDGWFRGKNWQNISGVFPGNYCQPLRQRDQQQLMHQCPYQFTSRENSTHPTIVPSTGINSATNTKPTLVNVEMYQPMHPPDLPPRIVESPGNKESNATVWSRPFGQTVDNLFNLNSCSGRKPSPSPKVLESNNAKDCKDKDMKTKTIKSTGNLTAVSLMKRLTHIKSRSKSPNSSMGRNSHQQQIELNNSIDTVDAPSIISTKKTHSNVAHANNNLNPVHVRSGSCPSELMQSLPLDQMSSLASDTDKHKKSTQNSYGSQRIKSNKERQVDHKSRPSLNLMIHSIINNGECEAIAAPVTASMPQQQTLKQPVKSINEANSLQHHHRKSQSLDASTVLANSSNTPSNSLHNTAEKRFRCIVPYPPNSDVELELHVGDIIFVQRKQKSGWYFGRHGKTNKVGLFPSSFVEPDTVNMIN